MEPISLTVRCTREEYMTFCVERQRPPVWTTIGGLLLLIVGAAEIWLFGGLSQSGLLILFLAVLLLLASPLILPTVYKGEGGRRYDASDALQQSVTLTFHEDTVDVRSATADGTVPLKYISRITETKAMLAIDFADELTLIIPKRAASQTELDAVKARLMTAYKG